MMRVVLAAMLAMLLSVLCACAGRPTPVTEATAPPQSAYQKITAAQAKAMMDKNEHCILLDVRTEEEFNQAHISGAVLIPDDAIRGRAEAELTDKQALILVYCRTGRRSALAAQALLDLGYTNVYDFGGITDWPYGTVRE